MNLRTKLQLSTLCVSVAVLSFISKKTLFFYLFMAVPGLRCCVRCSLVVVRGLLIVVASLVAEPRPWCTQAQWLWWTGLVAPRLVGSSWIRDQTRVSCTGRQTL